MSLIHCSEFIELDTGLLADFLASLDEAQEEIVVALSEIKKSNQDAKAINQLFRSVHSVKGNCRMVFLDAIVPVVHVIEEILDDARKQQIRFSVELADFVQESMDLSRILIREVAERGVIDAQRRDDMVALITGIRGKLLSGAKVDFAKAIAQLNQTDGEEFVGLGELPSDLQLMKDYAHALDGLSNSRRGRSAQTLTLCKQLNESIGLLVDPTQLEAAVYMHDFGMSLVNPHILQKEASLEKDELRSVQHHVFFGARFLQRLGGWDEAALMVLQHHERMDGTGYPFRVQGKHICIGARLLAVADTFISLTNERSDRTYKKTLFGAVREVNANAGAQFDQELVERFNEVIRAFYLSSAT